MKEIYRALRSIDFTPFAILINQKNYKKIVKNENPNLATYDPSERKFANLPIIIDERFELKIVTEAEYQELFPSNVGK